MGPSPLESNTFSTAEGGITDEGPPSPLSSVSDPSPSFVKPGNGTCVATYEDCAICNNTIYNDTSGSVLPIGFLDRDTFACPNARGANWSQLSRGMHYDYTVKGMEEGVSYLQAARGDSRSLSISTNGVGTNREQVLFCNMLRNPGTNTPYTRKTAPVPNIYRNNLSRIYALAGLSYMQFNTMPTWEGVDSTSKDDGKMACGMCIQLFGSYFKINETGFIDGSGNPPYPNTDENNNSIIVMVADQCYDGFKGESRSKIDNRNCGSGHIDIDVFDNKATQNTGPTWWKAVPCPVTLTDGSHVSIEVGFPGNDLLNNNIIHFNSTMYYGNFNFYSMKYPIKDASFIDSTTKIEHPLTYHQANGWSLMVDPSVWGNLPFRFRLTPVEEDSKPVICTLTAEYFYPKGVGGGKLNIPDNPKHIAVDDDGNIGPLQCQFDYTFQSPPPSPPSPPTPPSPPASSAPPSPPSSPPSYGCLCYYAPNPPTQTTCATQTTADDACPAGVLTKNPNPSEDPFEKHCSSSHSSISGGGYCDVSGGGQGYFFACLDSAFCQ